LCVFVDTFLCKRSEIGSPPHTNNGTVAKIVPPFDLISLNLLVMNMLYFKTILRGMDLLAIHDQPEQKDLKYS
jgi:hypothetical protein